GWVTQQPHGQPTLTAAIRSFYESYPYPPAVTDLEPYRQYWSEPGRRRADFHLHWPWRRFREGPSILVAGCGTDQAAQHAVRWPAAQVTGIDISATSMRCTEGLKSRYGLENLTIRQLSVERAEELSAQFDQIVCTGVLHHLPDPVEGIRALRKVLKPDGVMH